jgi:hypothetical protein
LLRLAPRNDEARYRLAFALLLEERPEEAKTQLLEIIAQNSTSVEARWLLARQYVVEHRGGEALEQVEVILALEPDHAQANWVAGHLHVIRGDTLTGSDKLEVFKKLHVEGRQEEIRDLLLEQWSGQYGGAFGGER